MEDLAHFSKKTKHTFNSSCSKLASFCHSCCTLFSSYFHVLIFRLNPFWVQLHYFIIFSLMGYLALKVSKPRTAPSFRPKDLDLFFTSVSATTVSSMSTVEMEVFSNTQLVIITILMLLGGEVFNSMLGLQVMRFKLTKNCGSRSGTKNIEDSVNTDSVSLHSPNDLNHIELGLGNEHLKYNSIKYLSYVVLCYLLLVHIGGSTLISIYIIHVPSAREILSNKGLQIQTFSVFTTVSTLSSCGFIPTNENMMVFVKNSEKVTMREEFGYLSKNYRQLGYDYLLSGLHSLWLVAIAFGFILVQFILFSTLEWNAESMNGLNSYQKLVGSLFEVVNSRHIGESVVDLSNISPAILVVFILMMYLPSYISFSLADDCVKGSTNEKKSTQRKKFADYILFSQLSYLVIVIVIICITERQKMKEDPLNFNVLNITFEVVSAYGNVGFSMGYSCKRQLKFGIYCKESWYGFVGRWSNKGKVILILVMFFGRLKKFSNHGGRAWKLS
ncbi:sodium transporter HKT1 isoform X2 [Camellia sinensis]|uniref:sodium transporter HKT1 isoform X2 n=1 Tax=Camellia sinensis TaxID=4442 RepID=UPI0010361D76|nr:sodium transporter HKT1 isoform X2 [Camellia sinensis]